MGELLTFSFCNFATFLVICVNHVYLARDYERARFHLCEACRLPDLSFVVQGFGVSAPSSVTFHAKEAGSATVRVLQLVFGEAWRAFKRQFALTPDFSAVFEACRPAAPVNCFRSCFVRRSRVSTKSLRGREVPADLTTYPKLIPFGHEDRKTNVHQDKFYHGTYRSDLQVVRAGRPINDRVEYAPFHHTLQLTACPSAAVQVALFDTSGRENCRISILRFRGDDTIAFKGEDLFM